MAQCPHCGVSVGFLRAASAAPAFPTACHSCGRKFHGTGTLAAVSIASLGLVLGLGATVLTGRTWLGGLVVFAALILLAALARKTKLVVSTTQAVRQWRLGLGVLLVIALAVELWPWLSSWQ